MLQPRLDISHAVEKRDIRRLILVLFLDDLAVKVQRLGPLFLLLVAPSLLFQGFEVHYVRTGVGDSSNRTHTGRPGGG